ncbi:MAG: hypothetical protein M3R25_06555 [Bacteroidota bacterium]|nr:hypothetical protein [Bacteroidota bacterium]
MQYLLFLAFLLILVTGCLSHSEKPVPVEPEKQLDTTKNVFFRDPAESFLVIRYDGDSTKCYDVQSVDYKIVKIAPKGQWSSYVAKQTSLTKTCDGQEGQRRTITIELSPVEHPDELFFKLEHECDEIRLEHDHYHTIQYGCCDAEPIHKIYDYDADLITEGSEKILIGAIPNNTLKFYVGYSPSDDDSTTLGTVHLAFNDQARYDIRIRAEPLPADLCSQYTPEMTLFSPRGMDTLEVYNDEYQLWHLEQIESLDQFRDVSIRVEYLCDPAYRIKPVIIPIQNGLPFGKDSTVQDVHIIHRLKD